MQHQRGIEPYLRHYVDLAFERAALFRALRQTFAGATVLYPGCSIHITPSFFFPHVTYVDRSVVAQQFFRHHDAILAYVNSRKEYRPSAHLRFLAHDYQAEPLPIDRPVDLLLALFAPGVVQACSKYLRSGGLLLTHDFAGALSAVATRSDFELVATLRLTGGRYTVRAAAPSPVMPDREPRRPAQRQTLRRTATGLAYQDTVEYYLFRRCSGGERRTGWTR